jgi:hypothetical protein
MSLKNLFSKAESKHILPQLNVNGLLRDVESGRYVDEYVKRKVQFEPHVDYTTASNFAKFGLAEEYYDASIKRIYQSYPYDGSSYEKIKWVNECNGLDLHVFENGYPRTHGYAKFSPSGWGSRKTTSGSYGNPATKEYIYIKGGPNVDNIWNTASNRSSNLEIDGNKGNTVEFWLKKDAYQSLTKREVLFDSWTTGSYVGDHKYGRMTIELDSSNSDGNSPWVITYRSGSAGIKNLFVSGTAGLHASASDGHWHHYAFTFQNTGSLVNYRMYIDGELNHSILTGSSVGGLNTAIVGTIGSLVAGKDLGQKGRESAETQNPGLGFGKLSGSIDEFRYWKTRRSGQDIGRYWFTQVHGGTNTDAPNTDLGVYYKFNEGIALTSSVDNIVLDYSGRVTNGDWVGYAAGARSVKSAMIQSSASLAEFADPIIHTENPKVNKYIDDTLELGRNHDVNSNSCIYHSFPGWIVEDEGDDGGELKRLSQIMGSYFDTLFFQIESLSKLKHIKNEDYDKKPNPFMNRVLASVGFETPEVFIDADVLASLASRDEEKEFEQRLEDVKNVIYRNIYNNVTHIYKSKGTERAFRNLLRCYGIDNELVQLNTYADGVDYPVEQNYRVGNFRTKCINFNRQENFNATVFQYSSSLDHSHKSVEFPVSGYITGAHANDPTVGLSFTTEAEIIFPYRHKKRSKLHIESPISSSLFGAHTVLDSHGAGHDLTWRASAKDFANFEVYAVKLRDDSRHARFVIKSTSGIVTPMETKTFHNVYEGQKWNFAVRVAPNGTYGSSISGSTNSYNLEFFGVKTDAGETEDEFLLTKSLTKAQGERFHEKSKRLYIGAHRQNFTGSTKTLSDVQVSHLRHWVTYLNNETIRAHAIDPKSYGVDHPLRNAYTFQPGLDNSVPEVETLALNWDFGSVTGSTKGGNLVIEDISSGSFTHKRDYGWVGDVIGSNHPGRGLFFPAETTSSIAVAYLQTARQQLPESVHSTKMINILTNDDNTYTRESRPVNHFFSIEKSMYRAISEEMLDMFATIKDFSNIVGDPINRYRPNYKSMEKLRQLFYERVENTPSIEKYLEFYKWIDSSLSIVLDQLKPASANFSEDVRTMIESHVLERNKYWSKIPNLHVKTAEPVLDFRGLSGVGFMIYNWNHGHSPIPRSPRPQDTNHLYWSERAERKNSELSTGDSVIDGHRDTLSRIAHGSISGSTYMLRAASKPYKVTAHLQPVIHAGDNYHLNKKKDFYLGTTNPGAKDFIRISGSGVDFGKKKEITHPRYGNGLGSEVYEKKRAHARADLSNTGNDLDADIVAPFSLYSCSVDTPVDYKSEIYRHFKKSVDITNLHSDAYGDDREIPIQSPFTQHWVGGHEHRHQHLNIMRPKKLDTAESFPTMSLDTAGRRFEAFHITMSQGQLYVTSPNLYALNHEPPGTFNVSLTSSAHNRARILREPVAKRPVNIRNIKTTASLQTKEVVLNVGNYKHSYEIVQGTSVEVSPAFLIRTGSVEPVEKTSNSPFFVEINERRKFERPKRKNVFVNRFSAPGGPETAGDSLGGPGLDIATNQYSVYNTLNYRNLMTRLALNEWSVDRMGGFGHAHNSSITSSSPTASYHKVNSNPMYVATGSGESSECRPKYDNQFVQHQIPRTDLGYSWINASTLETTCSYTRLESDFTYPKAQSDETVYQTNLANAIDFDSPRFLSASSRGLRESEANRLLSYGDDHALTNHPDPGVPTDFLGLNSVIYEHISGSNNTLGGMAPIDSRGGLLTGSIEGDKRAYTLNHILLNRGSLYGHSSWKQMRAGDHPIARKLRKENIVSIAVRRDSKKGTSFTMAPFANSRYNWPEVIDHRKAKDARTVSIQRYRFTESAVTSKYKPLRSADILSVVAGAALSYGSLRSAAEDTSAANSFVAANKVTYGNDMVSFSNPELVNMLQINEREKGDFLATKISPATLQTLYSETIFPRDVNSYSSRARGREDFIVDWWSEDRNDRAKSNVINSQGSNSTITSIWPLDAQANLGKAKEFSLGADNNPGSTGEGELMSTHGLFRTGSSRHLPSASAFYSRRFPETPVCYSIEIMEEGNQFPSRSMGFYVNLPGKSQQILVRYSTSDTVLYTQDSRTNYTYIKKTNRTPEQMASASVGLLNQVFDPTKNNTFDSFKGMFTASLDPNNSRRWFFRYLGSFENEEFGVPPVDGDDSRGHQSNRQGFVSWYHSQKQTDPTMYNAVNYIERSKFVKFKMHNTTYLGGAAKWEAGNPFPYDNYQSWAEQIRLMGKDYSVIPEFRISEHMPHYEGKQSSDPFYECPISSQFSLTGAADDYSDSSKPEFFKVLGHTDFIKYFDIVEEDHEELGMTKDSLTLRCKALKKFLPYDGLYPAQRTLQMATLFSQSYGQFMNPNPMGSWQTALKPFYAPGIAYNSIKSGIAVDYPIYEPTKDREFNRFCTRFKANTRNYVDIGGAEKWATLFTGSNSPGTPSRNNFGTGSSGMHLDSGSIAGRGISLSMWCNFYKDPDSNVPTSPNQASQETTSGSLVMFGDTHAFHNANATGIEFRKEGGLLVFGIHHTSSYKVWRTTGSCLSQNSKWYHIMLSYEWGNSTNPAIYLNGNAMGVESSASNGTFEFGGAEDDSSRMGTSILSSSGGRTDRSNDTANGAYRNRSNCTIGLHRYEHDQADVRAKLYKSLPVHMDEVSIWNTPLPSAAATGLYGGGISGSRGPWIPDWCVPKSYQPSLIGWFRMGDDTGYVHDGGSPSTGMTNQMFMLNRARSAPRSHILTNMSGVFAGFTDAWTTVSKVASSGVGLFTDGGDYQRGCGIKDVRELEGSPATYQSPDSHRKVALTGALMYPSFITGSRWNETQDSGIARIGSASWGVSRAGYFGSDALDNPSRTSDLTRLFQNNWWGRGKKAAHGIDKVTRVPFEAIIDPKLYAPVNLNTTNGSNFVVYDNEPHPSASLHAANWTRNVNSTDHTHQTSSWGTPLNSSQITSSFNLDSINASRAGFDQYSLAANNFFAESMNFFLKDGHGTVIATNDRLEEQVNLQKTYKMRIKLLRDPSGDFPMYNRASAFGPPVDAGDEGFTREQFAHGSLVPAGGGDRGVFMNAWGYAPFTPPHYDGFAEIEYSFRPSLSGSYTKISEVLERISTKLTDNHIKSNRMTNITGSWPGLDHFGGQTNSDMVDDALLITTSSLNKSTSMQLSASFYGMGLEDKSIVPVFENTRDNQTIMRDFWAIQTKFECPTFDFRNVSASSPVPPGLTKTIGMWHQSPNNVNESPIQIQILPPGLDSGASDLSNLLGLSFVENGKRTLKKTRKVGVLAETRTIKEAVVAIPFMSHKKTGKRRFFPLPRPEVYKAVKNAGHDDYKKELIDLVELKSIKSKKQKAQLSPDNRTQIEVRPSIQSMVDKMLGYVIPPKMNFLKYNDRTTGKYIDPFVMYIFEFEHTLKKKDLASLWQNLPPDIALNDFHNDEDDTLKAEAVVSHQLDGDMDLLSGKLNKEVKWLVFKVKQKAETNYFKKMERDKLPHDHPGRILSVEDDIYEYGFNWPYDYFSLVELIKLDAEVGFIKKSDAAKPPSTEEIEEIVKKTKLIQPAPKEMDNPHPESRLPFAKIVPEEDE